MQSIKVVVQFILSFIIWIKVRLTEKVRWT